MRVYSKLFGLAAQEWAALALTVGLTVSTVVVTVAKPWPIKLLADFALGQKHLPDSVQALASAVGVTPRPASLIIAAALAAISISTLNTLLDAALSWQWTVLGQRMARRLSTDLFAHLLHLPLGFFHTHRLGDILQRLSTDTWAVSKLVNGLLVTPATKLLAVGMMATVAWHLDHQLALYSFATAPLMAVATLAFAKPLRRRNRLTRDVQGRFASFVQQTLSAIPLVQAFDAEKLNSRSLSLLAAEATLRAKHGLLLARSYGFVTGLISVCGSAVIIYVGGLRAVSGSISIGTYLVFLAYLRNTQHALESLLKLYGSFQPFRAGLERVFEIFGTGGDVIEAPHAAALPSSSHPLAVSFEQVTFAYRENCPVLRDFSVHIHAGESFALVGRSGAGKSTALSLVPRLADPAGGRVLIGGIDLRELQLRSVRQRVSFFFQDSCLLGRTMAENIAYGCPDATRSEIIAAATKAKADQFIAALPQGYDSVIGERGATLSGGERQRIALARAFLKDAPILLLDEPTSACDAATEAELTQIFAQLAQRRTTLIVAHRLSTVRWVDRIAVLENGRITEMGSPAELLEKRGAFHRLHTLQTRGNREEACA